jgi:hypothetical protein
MIDQVLKVGDHVSSRFGHDWDPNCMKMDETLFAIAEKVNFEKGVQL